MPEHFDQAFWDEHYRSHPTLWSGNPNAHLLEQTAGLAPGLALDIACGEGADAIWLAQRGWRVTGLDLSAVALGRAAANARQAGGDVAERINWVQADLRTWEPGTEHYDLVASHYMHLPSVPRRVLFDHLASAVAPGGTLLIVGHHPSDLQTTVPRPKEPDLFFTGDDIAAQLDAEEWMVDVNEAPGRTVSDPEGRDVTVHDTVFRAHRRCDV
jgi:SAM-dependent methyltransferase